MDLRTGADKLKADKFLFPAGGPISAAALCSLVGLRVLVLAQVCWLCIPISMTSQLTGWCVSAEFFEREAAGVHLELATDLAVAKRQPHPRTGQRVLPARAVPEECERAREPEPGRKPLGAAITTGEGRTQ